MRITGLGHAGMFIETAGGSILCDPVIGPTFFGSWFPFPDNRGLWTGSASARPTSCTSRTATATTSTRR